jgi:tripartite-type tricarboxylate transporter receptor subunit TctC
MMTLPVIYNRKLLALMTSVSLLTAAPMQAFAQAASDYPSRPIELVVPFGAGGGTDILARVTAEAAKKHSSQPITVVNRPGASGSIGLTEVVNARPDGYKIAMVTVEMAIIPHMGIAKFSPEADFTPLVRLNADPVVLTVSATSPWKTIEEMVDAAKKSKDPLKFGNAGTGGVSHLAAVALAQKAGTTFNHVPFQGNAPAVVALLGGHIDAVTASPSEVFSFVQSGKLRALAVLADQRLGGAFAQVPTMKERNIDLSVGTWRGLAAPKGLPADVLARLSAIALKTANEPAVKEAMEKQNLGYSVADGEAFRKQIANDSALYKQLIEQMGLKAR